MTVDFSSVLPTVIVAIIGFLIRQSFKSFEDKLDSVVQQVGKLDERVDTQERRLSVTQAILKQKGVIS
jgi:hypothetical protein